MTHHPELFSQLKRVLADEWMPDAFQTFEGASLDEHTQRALHAVCVKTPMYGHAVSVYFQRASLV